MQWEIIYEETGTRDTYKGAPGRLHIPEARDEREVLGTIRFLLAKKRPVRITIVQVSSNKPNQEH